MKLTPQQTAFLDACSDTDSLILDSVAGSGKSTTLALGADVIPGTGFATSFSKLTTEDLKKKMPSSFPASTMHSAGLAALKKAWGKVTTDTSANKIYNFVKKEVDKIEGDWKLTNPILRLIDTAQTAGIMPNNERALLPDTRETWEALAEQYDIDFDLQIYTIAHAGLVHSTKVALEEHIVTFNEMLSLPFLFPFRVSQHKTIIVDEAQDLSPIQHALIARMLRQGGRIIGAGDKFQAIYGFRGAMTNSYSEFVEKFSAREMQLSVSFRCPKAVISEAQRLVPHIQSAPSAIEGSVTTHGDIQIANLPRVIICRNNSPLIKLALRLLAQGHPAEIAGKDIGAGLKALTNRVDSRRDSDHTSIGNFLDRLDRWGEKEIARKPKSAGRVADKIAALYAISESCRTLGDIRKKLESLFASPTKMNENGFLLSTIHKCKGLEWPHVAILDPWLMPSKFAEQEWEKQQEHNLSYVAITRAQQTLHYVNSDSIT
jgi:superfamily I DNA/RNA helicase